ncbi:MAG: hypothetical protein A2V98_22630 [Planctomycetes bacterium RBG_16_64_12]|nr:MAG: hypothetical protein A2V98_22630 [Planctomycetes bacterium RBG_16_64_12]
MNRYVCVALAALLGGGCGGPAGLGTSADGLDEPSAYDPPPTAASAVPALALATLPADLEPCLELDKAVRLDEPGPAGPITEAKCLRWTRLAELRLDLELERVRVRCLKRVLDQLNECEERYLDRVGTGVLYRGENAARQLGAFKRLRGRFTGDLAEALGRTRDLGELLARLEQEEQGGKVFFQTVSF